MARFSSRTLFLMALALISFGWMWWRTHLQKPAPVRVQRFVLVDGDGGSP